MIILSCNNLAKSFGIDVILDQISFSVNQGDKVGIVGANGAGKTTLFRILTGQYAHDTGDIYLSKNLSIGYLAQTSTLNLENTIFQEVLQVFQELIAMEEKLRSLEQDIAAAGENNNSEELNRLMEAYAKLSDEFQHRNGYGYRSELRGVLKGLGFRDEEFDQPIYQLSGGQKTRLNLAKLLLKQPDILMLDEPTNHLDIEATEWLEGFLKTYKGTILIISHDRYFLDEIVDKVFEIENTTLTIYQGNYSSYVDKKKILFEQQLKEYESQQKEILRQEEIIRRFKQHGTEKLAKRARSREKRLEHVEVIDRPLWYNKRTKIRFETQVKSGDDVLKVENLSKSFGDHRLFGDVDFQVYRGDKIGLIGPNGIGKSTLLKILLGRLPHDTGTIKIGHHVNLGYYDQEQSDLNFSNSIIDEIWQENIRFTQTEVRTLLGSFLFSSEDVFKIISTLSGGEKSRVALLKLVLSKANFLLMDEPTNHLDIASKEVLEDALLGYDGTLLVISHDRYFLNKVTNKILELSPDGILQYLGNYRYYQEKKRELETPMDEENQGGKTKTQMKDEKKKDREKREETKKRKQEQTSIEAEITATEVRIADLEALMCQEEIYSNPQRSREIHEETTQLKTALEVLYSKWEEYIE
ncbi:MAG: thiamine transporter substrate-binding protein [Anaerosolibacter sp.]|jgi:ATP-binding cassette subfamily F protein 3|uniref:ABC-F family ATP-binding cassette domain-containing protein n=1 Tax=Anaerosolibacter sp. TaxID=1872527 RepID=UPI00262BD07F|nr:ABC-F family ATP-binding cassette domain-containing protein [Anaerosolibacter sp.]MDF2546632.1 thiamine transporter substrate-binding protein [Anaerosolibacter sp.]